MILYGRQNIGLKGNWDDAKHDQGSKVNTGNFKALLQYRVNDADAYLGGHLQNAPRMLLTYNKTQIF